MRKCKQKESDSLPEYFEEMKNPKNLQEIASSIRYLHNKLNIEDNRSLNSHINAGKMFLHYQQLFKGMNKKADKHTTWKLWIKDCVQICNSYVYQHIQIYKLTVEYPGLCQLNIPFTRLFSIRNKIKNIFSKNPELAKEWKINNPLYDNFSHLTIGGS